jgi:hypothetical protein
VLGLFVDSRVSIHNEGIRLAGGLFFSEGPDAALHKALQTCIPEMQGCKAAVFGLSEHTAASNIAGFLSAIANPALISGSFILCEDHLIWTFAQGKFIHQA